MYERLLDKTKQPTFDELAEYCGENQKRFKMLNDFLSREFSTNQEIRFPYGKNYGWGVTHRKGKKLICDIFAENNSFCVMLRLSDNQFISLYSSVKKYTQDYIDNRYPCGSGGWIHYRVTCDENLRDIEMLLKEKCNS